MAADGADAAPGRALGQSALWGAVVLLLASPLMRGGNRHVALVVLEWIAIATLLAWFIPRCLAGGQGRPLAWQFRLLASMPLVLAVVQLVPLPPQLWLAMAGHEPYAAALQAAGASVDAWRPLSMVPDATRASLLAALPVAAAFIVGHDASLAQLRLLLRVVVVMALGQIALGLLQAAGGENSALFLGIQSYGPPIGTFANRNHLGNYVAMALAALIWLAYESHRAAGRRSRAFGSPQEAVLWTGCAMILVLGVLMTRSRGASLFGIAAAVGAFSLVAIRIQGTTRGLRMAVPAGLLMILGAATLVGLDTVQSRLGGGQLASSAGFRGALALSSLQGAVAFWPWGSGMGTYDAVYPRFQPASVAGFANHAHQDYAELLLEGGLPVVIGALLFAWLAARQLRAFLSQSKSVRGMGGDAMAAAVCGLGLAGFLLHSLVEFNMRIPANAILAALLAGAFLRPLHDGRP